MNKDGKKSQSKDLTNYLILILPNHYMLRIIKPIPNSPYCYLWNKLIAVQHERGPRNSTLRRQMSLYFKEGIGGTGSPSSAQIAMEPSSSPVSTTSSSQGSPAPYSINSLISSANNSHNHQGVAQSGFRHPLSLLGFAPPQTPPSQKGRGDRERSPSQVAHYFQKISVFFKFSHKL